MKQESLIERNIWQFPGFSDSALSHHLNLLQPLAKVQFEDKNE